jgi:integrase
VGRLPKRLRVLAHLGMCRPQQVVYAGGRRESAVRSLKRLLAQARLPTSVRFHDIRHTAGTLALRQGVPLHTVSKMLGHSDPAMTLRRYAHVLEDMREDAARAMDELF